MPTHKTDQRDRTVGRKQRLSWRPNVWLTTLSTVVAIAAGMFSLLDQIFPQEAGEAPTSIDFYEESVADLCSDLNQAEAVRKQDAPPLAKRLRQARTTLAQRNGLLDSNKEVLGTSGHLLARFMALEAPRARATRHQKTQVAWAAIVRRLRDYAQRLDAATSRRELLSAVNTLPRMRRALAPDYTTREAGLVGLGGGRCRVERQSVIPTTTLPPINRAAESQAREPPATAVDLASHQSSRSVEQASPLH